MGYKILPNKECSGIGNSNVVKTLDEAVKQCNLDHTCRVFYLPKCDKKNQYRLCKEDYVSLKPSKEGHCVYVKGTVFLLLFYCNIEDLYNSLLY